MSTAGMIDIQGTTVNIDASSIMLKGGMFTHVPGGGGGGGGGGAGGGSGSADFAQSEIGKYEKFKFEPDESAVIRAQQKEKPAPVVDIGAETPAPVKDELLPELFNARWSKKRSSVSDFVYVQCNVANFKGGESVKIIIEERDAQTNQKNLTVITSTIKEPTGMVKIPWNIKSENYKSSLTTDKSDIPAKPIEFHFTLEVNGEKVFNATPLILTTTYELTPKTKSGQPVIDGRAFTLIDAEKKEHNATIKDGKLVFEDVVLGAYTIKSTEKTKMTLSDKGQEFIKTREGIVYDKSDSEKVIMYNDSAGHATIGFGHLVHKGKMNGTEKQEFIDGITKARADELFTNDIKRFENLVNLRVKVELSQTQFDALVSFAYNIPSWANPGTDFLTNLNNGDYAGVPTQLKRWCKETKYEKSKDKNGKFMMDENGKIKTVAVKKVNDGLLKRRKLEGKLFSEGIY
jgi:GH24 family phage-related lysozyme (muramidase)